MHLNIYKKAIVIKHPKSKLPHLDSELTYFVPVSCICYGFTLKTLHFTKIKFEYLLVN